MHRLDTNLMSFYISQASVDFGIHGVPGSNLPWIQRDDYNLFSGLSVLPLGMICLFVRQSHAVLITVTSECVLTFGSTMSPDTHKRHNSSCGNVLEIPSLSQSRWHHYCVEG